VFSKRVSAALRPPAPPLEKVRMERAKAHRRPANRAAAKDDIDGVVRGVVAGLRATKIGKESSVQLFGEDTEADVREWISTGFPNIDAIFGGGWPVGRISELSGAEASGKSALADFSIVQVQKMGGYAVVLDFENTRTKDRLVQCGADLNRIVFPRPQTAEQGWEIVWRLMDEIVGQKNKPPVLFVWDSLGGTDIEDADQPGGLARVMSKHLRRLYHRAPSVRAHFLFVNQERDKFGGRSFIRETDTPGGRALKFACTIRAQCRAWYLPRKGVPKTGLCCSVRTIKNKVVAPNQSTQWVLDFAHGPSPELTALHHGLETRWVKTVSGLYTCPLLGRVSRAEWVARLRGDSDLARQVWDELRRRSAGPAGDDDDDDDDEC